MTPPEFQYAILTWHKTHGRHDLPWQQRDYYCVWVSEIMLQQTQVMTVIGYFKRFMQAFPTVQDLAHASQEQVLQYWSGLGYYARGRNLHKAAKIIMNELSGQFPKTQEGWMALPGVGKSTAAAVLAFVDYQPLAIFDGNVKRVLGRYCAEKNWPGEPKTEQKLWQHAQGLMPQKQGNAVANYTQAMMDIGATLCTRTKPKCLLCPIQQSCKAHQTGEPEQYPGKKPKLAQPVKHSYWLFLVSEQTQQIGNSRLPTPPHAGSGDNKLLPSPLAGEGLGVRGKESPETEQFVFLEKRPPKGIWGGLFAPLMFTSESDLHHWLAKHKLSPAELISSDVKIHVFTHFKMHYKAFHLHCDKQNFDVPGQWHALHAIEILGLATPVAKALRQLRDNIALLTSAN